MVWAIIKFNFEGVHKYPEAPIEVAFLRNEHRHIFYVDVYVEQFHDNRDVEYIALKRKLQKMYNHSVICDNKSCEMLAKEVKQEVELLLPDRKVKVAVFEDMENGSLVE